VSGQYFANRRPKRSSKASYDAQAAARLWQVSAGLVGLGSTRPRRPQQQQGKEGENR
jgi:hypothetical protein